MPIAPSFRRTVLTLVALCSTPLAAADAPTARPGEHPVATALRTNPLAGRADLARAVCDLMEPVRAAQVVDGFDLGESAAHYGRRTVHLEAYSRSLWGLVPLEAGGGPFTHWDQWRSILVAGTDPASPGFWGLIDGGDQRAVEMAAVAVGLLMTPERLWEPLDAVQRDHLADWLRSIERCKGIKNNWIFFRILVHVALERHGRPYDRELHAADLAAIDRLYLGDGWYSDGPGPQRDYYIPMAMHYYGMIYARFAAERDPQRCARFRERAAAFAGEFAHWFTPAGDALPYGRSLTYRFAQGAFWSALAWSGIEAPGLTRGQVKGLLMRHLRWWFRQPIIDRGGLLSIGYTYPNLMMSEGYNAPGSPYWAQKTMLILGLPAADPFWSLAEEPLPARPAEVVQAHAGMVIQHDDARSHTIALASGQQALFMAVPSGNKYAKFAYSTAAGFGVMGAESGTGGGGHDSTLAVSDDGQHYRSREGCSAVVVRGDVLASRWSPLPGVSVETWLAPAGFAHVRIHHITTPRKLQVAETGFSLGQPDGHPREDKGDGGLFLTGSMGVSGLRDLVGGGSPSASVMRPNLNLLHPRAVFPQMARTLQPGDHWLAAAVVTINDPAALAEARAAITGITFQPGPVPQIVRGDTVLVWAEPIPAEGRLTPVTGN